LSKIGIITALRSEARFLSRDKIQPLIAVKLNENALLVLSGMGPANVAAAIDSLIAQNVDALVSFGTAGALHEDSKSGDIIIPENIITYDNQSLNIASAWRDNVLNNLDACPVKIHRNDIYTSERVISTITEKRERNKDTGAIAVDMESALIANAAKKLNLPCLVIRVVVDEVDTVIPAKVLDCTDIYGDVAYARLLMSILKQPGLIGDLLKLGSAFKLASESMQWLGKHPEQLILPD
jgi:adenosylhomocysteine nucleosidase